MSIKKVFTFQYVQIPVVVPARGEPLLGAWAVAVALGYEDPMNYVMHHCPKAQRIMDWIAPESWDCITLPYQTIMLTKAEADLMASRSSDRKKGQAFRQWVLDELEPNI